jgi:hypothetical protein
MVHVLEIDVSRKALDIDYHLEEIIAEMLRNATTHFIDKRNYQVDISDDDTKLHEIVTAEIEIKLQASDTLLESASKRE